MGTAPENFNNPNYTYPSFPNVSKTDDNISEYVSSQNLSVYGREMSFEEKFALGSFITLCVILIFGAVGNGIVIWFLGFRIKRNPFMIYILNLAIADFGVLLSIISLSFWYTSYSARFVFVLLFQFMYSTSQYLLTAISIDRCVAVFFPLWHQCKRSPRLSTIICAFIWFLSTLLTGVTCTRSILNTFLKNETIWRNSHQWIGNAVLCLPVMTIATVALLIKVCLKAQQYRRRRLLTVILLSLLFFILFAFPLNGIAILSFLTDVPIYMVVIAFLLACLNSSVNPVIYFLVGRQRRSRRRENMKMILQKVFKEEESYTEKTSV